MDGRKTTIQSRQTAAIPYLFTICPLRTGPTCLECSPALYDIGTLTHFSDNCTDVQPDARGNPNIPLVREHFPRDPSEIRLPFAAVGNDSPGAPHPVSRLSVPHRACLSARRMIDEPAGWMKKNSRTEAFFRCRRISGCIGAVFRAARTGEYFSSPQNCRTVTGRRAAGPAESMRVYQESG